MWRLRWQTFWWMLPVSFAVLLVVGGALVVIGIVLTFLNWGLPVPGFARITEFLLGVPFEPRAEPRGNYLWSTLALTAAMNVATWATLGSLLAGAAVTALVGFRRSRTTAT